MTCIHLRKLYQLCQDEQLRIGGADLVRFVCTQCGEQEVCPSRLLDEYQPADDDEEPPQKREPGE